MMEEEIKVGEQERENLRIETQRLRDELSDLKIEAEIMQDKLRKRQLPSLATDITAPNSPSFEGSGSPNSTASSPMITTPPDTKSVSTTDTVSETPTPPSPPMSDASTTARPVAKTPINPPKSKLKLPSGDSSTTPKPSARYASSNLQSSRGPALAPTSSVRNRTATPSVIRNTKTKAPATRGLPNSTSLTHIRSLTAQMQRLEQRVQSARSKLPAPVSTPPRASPRTASAMGQNYMPPSVTIRSRKRTGGSTASGSSMGGEKIRHQLLPSMLRDYLHRASADYHSGLSRAANPAKQADPAVEQAQRPTYDPTDLFPARKSPALPPDPRSQALEHHWDITHSHKLWSRDAQDLVSVGTLGHLMDMRILRVCLISTLMRAANWILLPRAEGIHPARRMWRGVPFQLLHQHCQEGKAVV